LSAVDRLSVQLGEVTSSGVGLSWAPIVGSKAVRVFLSAEPANQRNTHFSHPGWSRRLAADASGYRFDHLAPGVDAFLRVEVDTPGGTQGQNVHVHTPGGPRARLEGPVRSVHVVAPDTLLIVLAAGAGERWAAGPWTVRRLDGRNIPVKGVHRHSLPVAQPDYRLGFGVEGGSGRVDVDQRIFLVLGSPICAPEILRGEGPSDLAISIPFSDRYLETPVIQLNQVGYNPRARARWAYVSGWMGSGAGLPLRGLPASADILAEPEDPEARRATVVAGLPITERASNDLSSGGSVRQIDLASVGAQEGRILRIRIPGVGVSYPTQISETAAFKAFFVTARGMFLNRWGGDLRPAYTEWSRPRDHAEVFTAEGSNPFVTYPENTPRRGRRRLAGGYHDAGDFDQRPMHSVVPQVLLRAFELEPARFTDGQLGIPESGNGVPDILDEALWGIAAWEQLQEAGGGVRPGVESFRHPWGYYHADQDPLPYWTFAVNADHSARVAGVFAQAARLLAQFDRRRSAGLRKRAENAWRWAKEHGAKRPFRLYAEGELYRLTGASTHRRDFETDWAQMGQYGAFSNMASSHLFMRDYEVGGQCMPDYILGYLGAQEISPEIRATALRWLDQAAARVVDEVLRSPHAHRNARRDGRPTGWGLGTVMGRYLDPIFARLQFGGLPQERRQEMLDAMSVAADFVLGANPDGMVYITGLGSRRPQEPLHLDSLAFLHEGRGPMPGIPVYGPSEHIPHVGYYEPGRLAFFPPFDELPPMRRYADIRTFVRMNECTIWECQAPHTVHFAALVAPGLSMPAQWRPGMPGHRSPYPGRTPVAPVGPPAPAAPVPR
jgi:endoglucanase